MQPADVLFHGIDVGFDDVAIEFLVKFLKRSQFSQLFEHGSCLPLAMRWRNPALVGE